LLSGCPVITKRFQLWTYQKTDTSYFRQEGQNTCAEKTYLFAKNPQDIAGFDVITKHAKLMVDTLLQKHYFISRFKKKQ
jgi:hypothetical protein